MSKNPVEDLADELFGLIVDKPADEGMAALVCVVSGMLATMPDPKRARNLLVSQINEWLDAIAADPSQHPFIGMKSAQ